MNWGRYRRNKYGNRKTMVAGRIFDSQKEASFYLHLESVRQNLGYIKEIECQPVIQFPDGTKMIPDFKVSFNNGLVVYYDVKSPATQKDKTYRLKKRLLKHFFPGIDFREVVNKRDYKI